MTDFVTGCTHFGHESIIKLAQRPFADVQEMDQALIDNWNGVVRSNDTVYHLGDFAFRGGPGEDYLKQLNGRVVCLRGNHDPKGWGAEYMTVKCNKVRIIMFHYPIEEWEGFYRGTMHLHCHTHKPDFKSGTRRGNVGVEATGFTPMKLTDAVARLLD